MNESTRDVELTQLLEGLRASPPRIAPRYLYDKEGSRLFERITRTSEYYPTRTELTILRERGARLAAQVSPGAVLLELGSGSADKALVLLSKLERPLAYRPIDISRDALDRTVAAVRSRCPELQLWPVCGDFTDAASVAGLPEGAQRLVYYSGSTLGNFEPAEAVTFLRALRRQLRSGDLLLLGVDLVKEPGVLNAAYNDAAGVTAAFNLNVLRHLNARFGADFQLDAFEHRAFYDARRRRIEMHLVPCRPLLVRLGGEELRFEPSRPIHTEYSYKFTLDDLRSLATTSGYCVRDAVTDQRCWFADALLEA